MGKLINKIPGSCLLISSLPGSALRTLVEQAFSKPCLVNLISKDTHQVFSISHHYAYRHRGGQLGGIYYGWTELVLLFLSVSVDGTPHSSTGCL